MRVCEKYPYLTAGDVEVIVVQVPVFAFTNSIGLVLIKECIQAVSPGRQLDVLRLNLGKVAFGPIKHLTGLQFPHDALLKYLKV